MKTYWIESGGEPVYILAVIGYFVCLYTLGGLTLWAVFHRRWVVSLAGSIVWPGTVSA